MQKPSLLTAAVCLLALAAGACRKAEHAAPPPPAPRPEILKDVSAVGPSIVTDTTGTVDAERRSYLVQLRIDSIGSFYRSWLPAHGWSLRGDRSDSNEVNLYARKDSLTLWVHAKRLGAMATEYTLIANQGGASAPAATPQ